MNMTHKWQNPFFRYWGLPILVGAILFLLPVGCQGSTTQTSLTTAEASQTSDSLTAVNTETSATTTAPAETTAVPTPAEPTSPPVPLNLLTGEPMANADAASQRPVAIMINNIKVATPQIGTSQADLLYETLVEGGITRMMAVFADAAAIPEIGSIRSARHDYIDLAGGLDAILTHFGASNIATDQFARQNTEHVDLGTLPAAYWRDPTWMQQRGTEHSAKSNAARIQDAIAQLGYRTTVRDGQKPAFLFRPAGSFAAAAGDAANQVSAPFSGYVTATFTYDAATQLYNKGQFGKPHLDMATGQPIAFTNVLLLQTQIEACDSSGHMDVQLASGTGYYIAGGQWQAMTWTKGDTGSSFVFTDANGQELLVNTGKSYIGILPDSSHITIS